MACGRNWPPEGMVTTCPHCNENLDARYDYNHVNRIWSQSQLTANPDRSHWRYAPLLPVNSPPENTSIQVGGTPLISVPRLAAELGLDQLWIKDDSRNPSGSLKDRASDVGLRHAQEGGHSRLIAASTGNAAASLAALGAHWGAEIIILAPASAPRAKLAQILQHGATLILVDGTYDEAFDLSLELSRTHGIYSRNTGINPVLSEGKKTVALEILEQRNWRVPDAVFVPVGDGCILGGVYKGFHDLYQLGWTEGLPQLMAVQAEGSDAVIRAWETGYVETVKAQTIADSIAVDLPRDWRKAVRALNATQGNGIRVTDNEILDAQALCSATTGLFVEPAAAAALAGCIRAVNNGQIHAGDEVILLMTGSGLKDIPAALKQMKIPTPLEPRLDAVENQLRLSS